MFKMRRGGDSLKFINLTRRTEIGANSYYLEIGRHRLVLDCGMHPEDLSEDALPNLKAIADREIEAILIPHAHQDHIGTLPVLMRRFPNARVFTTEATAEIGNTLLHNSVNVMTRQREEIGERQRLAEAIGSAFDRGACVLIPVFALGKTQEVLAMLYKFRRERLLPEFPIYIGGLSSKMTDIYDRRARMTRRQLPRLELMRDAAPFILNDEKVRDAPLRSGRVYALSSGMMIPKTLSNIFARRMIANPQHSIFFVGYANPESPGGLLREAGTNSEVALDPDKPAQRVRCNIEQFQFSAHATREGLIDYAKKLSPGKIVLVHGDPPAVDWMRATLSAELPDSEVIMPEPGVELDL